MYALVKVNGKMLGKGCLKGKNGDVDKSEQESILPNMNYPMSKEEVNTAWPELNVTSPQDLYTLGLKKVPLTKPTLAQGLLAISHSTTVVGKLKDNDLNGAYTAIEDWVSLKIGIH